MPLKVIIAGAGLGGLGAAIAMARAGHNVEVFEQSRFLNEIGAAIHIAPNATRVLKSWDIEFTELQAVLCNAIKIYDHTGKLIFVPVSIGTKDEWLLTHRVDLHSTLRKAATEKTFAGTIKIHTASKVVQADAATAEITLANSDKHKGDLLIGADGVHSKVVSAVAGSPPVRVSTKQNTFRFLVPIDKLMANPITGPFFGKLGFDCQHVFTTRDRRMVVYPCRNGKLLNIVAMHPSDDAGLDSESSWLAGGRVEELLDVYKEFGPELIEMCRIGEDLKLWSLATRDPPTKFWKGRTVLLGDAAHPMLPHQGQGGAQSFEDAAALGVLFPADTTVDDVPKRLELYNKLRYPRSVTVMFMSKINDERRGEMMEDLRKFVPDAELPPNIFPYLWNNFVLDDAQKALAAAA
ncbi:3-hydroxybenzoate 6-hydroxylase 1 [Fusarium odoratissimum]|uniref:3-hydroxybenzoate 6-hydroxylase 1 n=1 Tax=Fusarium oxysporum f. sp. cubense (strain race 4) TaxID=2502994 RepID=N1RSG1_FUSC4|nr:3-hydroxybenzoate 6-hydroxylase 1 [Fusarium odoratissimum]